ncbi:MAG: ABC transporter permease [Bacteroidales bacterium]|nr:ABC transporter permease [Bacteroidales bacterium]
MKGIKYIKGWFSDAWGIFAHELRQIVHDSGVMVIFVIGGLCYPLLYNYVYKNGILEKTPVAVVDRADCAESRRFIREMDATRELRIAARCTDMEEARELLRRRKINGIIYFPDDFGERLARMETAKLSIYADMSSFLYYKNVMMGSHFVMLHEIGQIQVDRYSEAGLSEQEARAFIHAIPYDDNNPYNRAFSYTIFLISAILLLVVQQVMFYGMSLLAGTMREENRSFAPLADRFQGQGVGRVILGRGGAYWLLFMGLGLYIALIVPAIFHFPQRGSFEDIVLLLLFYVTDCVFFSMTWSTLITRRESVFVLLLFISPICAFLTGFSWPESAFPAVWKYFSWLFPSTFGCRAFINLNTAGGDLLTVRPLMRALTLQTVVYFVLASVAIYAENFILKHKNEFEQRRERIEQRLERRLERREKRLTETR